MTLVFKFAVVLGMLAACAILGILVAVFDDTPAGGVERNPWEDER